MVDDHLITGRCDDQGQSCDKRWHLLPGLPALEQWQDQCQGMHRRLEPTRPVDASTHHSSTPMCMQFKAGATTLTEVETNTAFTFPSTATRLPISIYQAYMQGADVVYGMQRIA